MVSMKEIGNALRVEEYDNKIARMNENNHISKFKKNEPEMFELVFKRVKEWTPTTNKKYVEVILYNKDNDNIANTWCTNKEYNDYNSKNIS